MTKVIKVGTAEISESLLANVALYTQGFVIISDHEDRMVWVNKQLRERTGYTMPELLGRKPKEVFRGSKTNISLANTIDQAFKRGVSYEFDILNYTKAGDPFWVHMMINPVKGDDGKVEHYIAIGKEVTEHIEERDEMLMAKEEAELKTQQKQDLISILSHDLKSPLTSMKGVIELLKAESTDSKQRELIALLDMSSRNMENLVTNMLGLSKIERGEFPVVPQMINLRNLIEDTIQPLVIQAEAVGNELHLDIDPGVEGHYAVDPLRFSQVINNLVSNAIKFTDEGTIEVVVWKKAGAAGESMVQMKVRDTGRGIEPEVQERIFSKFSKAGDADTQASSGSGLGLTIVKHIMEKMNGAVWLESEPHKGSTFFIEFPLMTTAE